MPVVVPYSEHTIASSSDESSELEDVADLIYSVEAENIDPDGLPQIDIDQLAYWFRGSPSYRNLLQANIITNYASHSHGVSVQIACTATEDSSYSEIYFSGWFRWNFMPL